MDNHNTENMDELLLDEEFLQKFLDDNTPEELRGMDTVQALSSEAVQADLPMMSEILEDDEPITIRVSDDLMEAYVRLPVRVKNPVQFRVTPGEIMGLLSEHDIMFGVDPMAIKALCENPLFGQEYKVAQGEPVTEGEPGYYIYHFDTNLDRKPVVKEDGSVDYMAIKSVETVKKGDLIAEYVPAKPGETGTNVFGYDKQPKPVKELPPLPGVGFSVSEDGLKYYSDMAGKIEMKSRRVVISPVFETSFNVGTEIGNVEFEGDVIIHGSVGNGAVIRAGGNVTIDKLVEVCEIYSKKDIILKSGVKGADRTIIEAKGNITAEFIEFAKVHAEGTIEADVLFNSRVTCNSYIKMNGHHASIIGGTTEAIEGVDAYLIGNTFGVKTGVYVGLSQEQIRRKLQLQHQLKELSRGLEKIVEGLDKFERLAMDRGLTYRDDPRRIELLRVKIRNEAVKGEYEMEVAHINELEKRGERARIIVNHEVYPGVEVGINERRLKVKETFRRVEFRKSETNIRMETLD